VVQTTSKSDLESFFKPSPNLGNSLSWFSSSPRASLITFFYHTTSFMKVGSNMMSTSVSKVLKMMLKSKSMDTDGSSQ